MRLYTILDFGFWIGDFGFWILDFGLAILDFESIAKGSSEKFIFLFILEISVSPIVPLFNGAVSIR